MREWISHERHKNSALNDPYIPVLPSLTDEAQAPPAELSHQVAKRTQVLHGAGPLENEGEVQD